MLRQFRIPKLFNAKILIELQNNLITKLNIR
jgi:hypothetical protein